jgi:hypothetical protein
VSLQDAKLNQPNILEKCKKYDFSFFLVAKTDKHPSLEYGNDNLGKDNLGPVL